MQIKLMSSRWIKNVQIQLRPRRRESSFQLLTNDYSWSTHLHLAPADLSYFLGIHFLDFVFFSSQDAKCVTHIYIVRVHAYNIICTKFVNQCVEVFHIFISRIEMVSSVWSFSYIMYKWSVFLEALMYVLNWSLDEQSFSNARREER